MEQPIPDLLLVAKVLPGLSGEEKRLFPVSEDLLPLKPSWFPNLACPLHVLIVRAHVSLASVQTKVKPVDQTPQVHQVFLVRSFA